MSHAVSTLVYKYNLKGFWLIGLYILGLAVAIYHIFSMSTGQILFWGSVFLAVPLYVQYGNSEMVRMQVWDERKLIFSSEGIYFGDAHYPIRSIESAAIYLESFQGFQFRSLGTPGLIGSLGPVVDRITDGDANKISFRHGGIVEDFTFYLANYAQYAMLQAVLYDWSRAGVNVALKQQFEDEFIRGEMNYFQTPPGLAL